MMGKLQNSLTPFMNIRENSNKRVTFNMTDDIEKKIRSTDSNDG